MEFCGRVIITLNHNLYGWEEWQNWDWNGAKDPTSSSLEALIDQSSLETKSTILVDMEMSEFLNILDSSIIFNFLGK